MSLIILCGHCGNKTTHEQLSETTVDEKIEYQEQTFLDVESKYIITKCGTCNQVSIFSRWSTDHKDTKDLNMAVRIYPPNKYLPSGVPEKVNEAYKEAYRLLKISSQAYVILIRRSLELMCKDKNAKGRDLKSMIDDLALKGIIPNLFTDMGDLIRKIGNSGAHGDNLNLNKFDLELINDFFLAMVEFVYVVPLKIEKIRKRLHGEIEIKKLNWPLDYLSLN